MTRSRSFALEAPRSQAHFVWMRVSGMTSMQLAAAFQRAGVVVFPGSALGDAEHVRISLKSAAATDRLLAVLPEVAGATASSTSWDLRHDHARRCASCSSSTSKVNVSPAGWRTNTATTGRSRAGWIC